MKSMASTSLVPAHVFGYSSGVKDSFWHIDDSVVLFAAGIHLVLYRTDTHSQSFLGGLPACGFSCVALSPCRKLLAVAEKSDGGSGSIHLVDLETGKKKKVLTAPSGAPTNVLCMSFSSSGLLLAQSGAPEYVLSVWDCSKAKVVGSVKLAVSGSAPSSAVSKCSFNPFDPNVFCVTGHALFKGYRIVDGHLKSMPNLLSKVEAEDFTCHLWLEEERLVLGTSNGKMVLFQSGEPVPGVQLGVNDGFAVTCMQLYSEGFIAGSVQNRLRIFKKVDGPEMYVIAKDIVLPLEDVSGYFRDIPMENSELDDEKESARGSVSVCSISVSPTEKNIYVGSSSNKIYSVLFPGSDLGKADELNGCTFFSTFHASAITGMDLCIRKPIVATCGLDKTIRIWNYAERKLELLKVFSEETYSLSLHPSSLHILVGFADKLRLMNILMDDFRVLKELSIKACKECQFSNGGQHFAAMNGNTIQVFQTYSCECIATLRGHNGKIKSLYWAHDDQQLLSAGLDGAVYQWNIKELKREGEYVKKGCAYSSVVCNHGGDAMFAVGSDDVIREVEFPVSIVSKEIESDRRISQVVLSASQKMFFSATADANRASVIRAYKLPLTGEFLEFGCLSSPVTRLRISYDDEHLFACGEDGVLVVFDIKDSDRNVKGLKRLRNLSGECAYSEEILVTKSDLEEKTAMMVEFKNKVDELTLHNEYQLRLKDMNYNEKIKEVTEKYTQELEHNKNQFELLREEKNDLEMEYDEQIKQTRDKHQHKLQEYEATYQSKIMAEVERYQKVSKEKALEEEQRARQQEELVASHKKYADEICAEYEQQLQEEHQEKEQLEEDKQLTQREFLETRRQLEGDVDQEIEGLKFKYEDKLKKERDATLRFKGENGIMKKRFSTLQKDIEGQKEELKSMLEKEQELEGKIKSLEQDIQNLKAEIKERDETIGNKEKKIYDLKKRNQELEKFKFVLDYKIKELKRQIEPRENEIAEMKGQIKSMDRELEQFHRSNTALDKMIGELRTKLDGMQRTIMLNRQKLVDLETKAERFRAQLEDCAQHVQSSELLQESFQLLHANNVPNTLKTKKLDADIELEYKRQKEFLERTIDTLKLRLDKDVQAHKEENMAIVQANMELIKQINHFRQKIRNIKLHGRKLHTAKGKHEGDKDAQPPRINPKGNQQQDKS